MIHKHYNIHFEFFKPHSLVDFLLIWKLAIVHVQNRAVVKIRLSVLMYLTIYIYKELLHETIRIQ